MKQSINTDVKTFLLKKYESLLETKIHKMTIEKRSLNPDAPTTPELERSFGAEPGQSMSVEENSNFTTITKMDVQYTEEALIILKVFFSLLCTENNYKPRSNPNGYTSSDATRP